MWALMYANFPTAKDFPTKDYIERHKEAYTNANLTVWGGTRNVGVSCSGCPFQDNNLLKPLVSSLQGYEQYWPRNRLYDDGNGCSAAPRVSVERPLWVVLYCHTHFPSPLV